MEDRKKILIVDDHRMVRAGLKAIIKETGSYDIVGEAGNAREALALSGELRPDLVILDIDLPDRSGLDCIGELRERTGCEVMMLSMYSQQNYINRALSEGAKAYLLKESGQEKLIKALAALEDGDIYIDGAAGSRPGSEGPGKGGVDEHLQDEAYESLTSREQEVMLMLAEGLSVKEIAGKLFISARTVENHRSSIFRKLGTHSIIELVKYASRIGLIDLDSWG